MVGKAWKYIRIVKVEWPWLAIPLSLLLISGLFLIATVIRSSKDKVGIYKTSALASLFSGVGDQRPVIQTEDETRRGYIRLRAKVMQSSQLIMPTVEP